MIMSSSCVYVCVGGGLGCWYGNAVMLFVPCLLESLHSVCITFVKHSNLKSNKPPQHSLCSRVLLVRVEVIILISCLWKCTVWSSCQKVCNYAENLSLYYAAGHLLHSAMVIHLLPALPVSSSSVSFLYHLNCSTSHMWTHIWKHR